MKIKSVHMFTNGSVMAFDKKDKQVPECQGFIFEIANNLKKYCDKDTKFFYGEWKKTSIECNFSWYFKGEYQ